MKVCEVRFHLNCQRVCTRSNGKYYNRLWSQSWDFGTWTRSRRRWFLGYFYFILFYFGGSLHLLSLLTLLTCLVNFFILKKVPNLDLPAMCSPTFKPGPPSEKAQVLSDRLNQVLTTSVNICGTLSPPHKWTLIMELRLFLLLFFSNYCLTHLSQFRSNILPLSSLCIHRGKSVWVLYVDATCINYDGNAFDATLLAMVAALKNSTLYYYFRSVFFSPGLTLFLSISFAYVYKQHFLKQPSTLKRTLPSVPDELPNYLFNWTPTHPSVFPLVYSTRE